MHSRYSLGSGALIAALLTSTASFAEVTPQQVWDNWRSYMESYGYEIMATEAMNGGTLSISGMTMMMNLPEDGGTFKMNFGDVSFTDNGDGSVAIAMQETTPVNISIVPADGEPVDLALTYYLPNLQMSATGDPDNISYSFSGDEMSVTLDKLVVDGKTFESAEFQFGLSDVKGKWGVRSGDLQVIEQSLIAGGGMRYAFAMDKPEGDGRMELSGQSDRVNLFGTMALPKGYDPADLGAALAAGFAFDGVIALGAGNSSFSFRDESSSAASTTSSSGSSFSVAMSVDKMSYGLQVSDWAVSATGSELPVPVSFTSATTAVEMSMPLTKTDLPRDFSALVKIVDFAPDEMILGMLDPTGGLPHDPATLVIDIAGKARWLFDILDPEQAEALADADMPFELTSLQLKDLTLRAAGAELTGRGSFVFNNDDLETFDGFPAPDGSVDLRLVGGNGLIDSLLSMGLMSEDDAMGMRMMMSLFGRVGEGEDEVLSTIEVKSNGQILANGQRLQ